MCLAESAAISLPLLKSATWAGAFGFARRFLWATAISTSSPPRPAAGGRKPLRRRLLEPGVERHAVGFRVPLFLACLHESLGRTRLRALQTPLAVVVVDPAQADGRLRAAGLLLPDEAEVGTDDVAEAAVDALLQVEDRDQALPRSAQVLDDAVAGIDDHPSEWSLEVAEGGDVPLRRARLLASGDGVGLPAQLAVAAGEGGGGRVP